jgi:hypothetical protein
MYSDIGQYVFQSCWRSYTSPILLYLFPFLFSNHILRFHLQCRAPVFLKRQQLPMSLVSPKIFQNRERKKSGVIQRLIVILPNRNAIDAPSPSCSPKPGWRRWNAVIGLEDPGMVPNRRQHYPHAQRTTSRYESDTRKTFRRATLRQRHFSPDHRLLIARPFVEKYHLYDMPVPRNDDEFILQLYHHRRGVRL